MILKIKMKEDFKGLKSNSQGGNMFDSDGKNFLFQSGDLERVYKRDVKKKSKQMNEIELDILVQEKNMQSQASGEEQEDEEERILREPMENVNLIESCYIEEFTSLESKRNYFEEEFLKGEPICKYCKCQKNQKDHSNFQKQLSDLKKQLKSIKLFVSSQIQKTLQQEKIKFENLFKQNIGKLIVLMNSKVQKVEKYHQQIIEDLIKEKEVSNQMIVRLKKQQIQQQRIIKKKSPVFLSGNNFETTIKEDSSTIVKKNTLNSSAKGTLSSSSQEKSRYLVSPSQQLKLLKERIKNAQELLRNNAD